MALHHRLAVLAGLTALAVTPAWANLTLLSRYQAVDGGAEIVSYDAARQLLLTTYADDGLYGVEVIDLSDPAHPVQVRRIDLAGIFGTEATASVSSVAADPAGRGFGVATVIPAANTTVKGQAVVFALSTGEILTTLETGFHPDSVNFAPDGSVAAIADEGEFVEEGTQAPGSLTILDFAGVTDLDGAAALTQAAAATYDLSPANLAEGVSLAGLRYNTGAMTDEQRQLDAEPEYAVVRDGYVLFSLQEANALGVFDLATRKFTALHSLGTIEKLIDASDRDGGLVIDDLVHGLPMPDTVTAWSGADGQLYVATANEGDARPDDGDAFRAKDTGEDGLPAFNAAYKAELDARYGVDADALDDEFLGRLDISRYDGLNEAGEIVRLTAFGTRSFSIWNASTGALVYDSGSFMEQFILGYDLPTWDNGRSDNKGPEPEALTFGRVGNRDLLFVAAERTNQIWAFDVTNPAGATFYSFYSGGRGGSAPTAPEGMSFIPADKSPTGEALLVVSYEVTSDILVFQVNEGLRDLDDAPVAPAAGGAVSLNLTVPGALGDIWQPVASTIPAGLTFNPVNGQLSGTITSAGVQNMMVTRGAESLVIPFNVTANPVVITWPTPAAINAGMALGAAQLNATAAGRAGAAITGDFLYAPGTGAVLAPGTHTLTAVYNPTGTFASTYAPTTATTTIEVLGGYAGWAIAALASFPENQRGTMDDPNGDGVTNGIAYAHGLNPTETIAANNPRLPVVTTNADSRLVLTYQRPYGLRGVTYMVQYATTAEGPWTNLPGSAIQVVRDPATALETVTATDTVRMTEGMSRFLRLWVTIN